MLYMGENTGSNEVGKWLEQKFLEWQAAEGERKNLDQFATHLGTSRPFVSMVMGGKRAPSESVAQRWGRILGDFEICDLLGYERPDPTLLALEEKLKGLSPDQQGELLDAVDEYLAAKGWRRVK